ncbi:zinc finger protein 33B-like [Leptopilina heterotoma]|uniref:zinc finger protein 33B-like n=1 Tax=Leptopilina heterotoma TaxID=63436 RepID=UPI001CA89C30|nr:zinc finger protein 33B-like [Leptopilina heterotoma]
MESPVLLVKNLDLLIRQEPQEAVEECKFCRRNFGTLSGKTRHEDKCLQNPAINKELRRLRFSCHKCGFNFSSKGGFNKHKAYCGVSQKYESVQGEDPTSVLQEDEGVKFPCQFCRKNFASTRGRGLHENNCSTNPIINTKLKKFQIYSCYNCGYNFNQKSELTKHKLTNCGASNFCKKCNKTYASLDALKRHHRRVHRELYQGENFPTLYIRSIESLSARKEEEENYEEEEEEVEKKLTCRFCNRNFEASRGKTVHEKKCSHNPAVKEKNKRFLFSCHCGANFNLKYKFTRHKKNECGKTHRCFICHKIYKRQDYLTQHIRKANKLTTLIGIRKLDIEKNAYSHHRAEERINKTYYENMRNFQKSKNDNRNYMSHLLFSCEVCGYSSSDKYTMNRHKAYDCGVTHKCKEKFSYTALASFAGIILSVRVVEGVLSLGERVGWGQRSWRRGRSGKPGKRESKSTKEESTTKSLCTTEAPPSRCAP